MKAPIVMIFLLSTSVALAECPTGAVGFTNDLSYSLEMGGTVQHTGWSSNRSMTLPVTFSEKAACFQRAGHLSFAAKGKDRRERQVAVLSPMSLEFENVPNAKLYHYVSLTDGQLDVVSFACTGEVPVSEETVRTSLAELSVKGASVRATVGVSPRDVSRKNSIYEAFFNDFVKKTNRTILDVQQHSNVHVPSLLTNLYTGTLTDDEKTLYAHFFQDYGARLNGCSEEFRREMSGSLLEQVLKKRSLHGVTFRKVGAQDVELSWEKK